MLITRETDYSLRIVRGLSDYKRHTMKVLCESQQIPQQFAYKIIKKMSAANMIKSIRGVDGGVTLTCDLKEVTLYDLVNAIDQQATYINECMTPGYVCPWVEQKSEKCMAHCQLNKVQQTLDDELKSYTLHSLIFGDEKEAD